MWEDAPDAAAICTLAARRPVDLLPWLLSCGDTIEVLGPPELRREMLRIARAMADRHAAPAVVDETGQS
jgi:hypothetical protein